MQLPGIYFEVKADYDQVQREMREVRATVKEQATGISNALNNALSPGQISGNVNKLVANFGTLNRASVVTGTAFDKVGVDLKELSRNTGLTESQFSSLQSRLIKTQAAKSQERALRAIGRSSNLTKREVQKLGRQFNLTSGQIRKVNTQLGNTPRKLNATARAMSAMKHQMLALGAVYIGVHGIGAVIGIADKYSLLDSKLKLVTEDSKEFEQVYTELFDISQRTGSSFADNASNFSNLSLALKDTNITSNQTLSLFEDINKSLVVAGATTQEAGSFMLQFRQAMGSGKLAGDEFRGMMESNSYWGGLLAKALDTDIAGLREMSKAGELTTSAMMKAFPEMSRQISSDFDGIQKTIQRAMTELSNAFGDVIGDANEATGSTNKIATSVSDLATIITENKDTISDLFSGIITGSTEAVKGVGNVVRSIQGLVIVAASEDKSLLDWFVSDPDTMKQWQAEIESGVSFVKDSIVKAKADFDQLSFDKLMGEQVGAWSESAEEEYQAIGREVDRLTERLTRLQNAAIDNNLADFFGDIDSASSRTVLTIHAMNEEVVKGKKDQKTKIVRIKTDERYDVLQIQKKALREQLKAEEDYVDNIKDLSDGLVDVFEDVEEKRIQAIEDSMMEESLALDDQGDKWEGFWDELVSGSELTTESLSSNFGDFAAGVIVYHEDIGESFEALMESMLATFVSTLAEMAAEYAASEVWKAFTKESSSNNNNNNNSNNNWLEEGIDTVAGWFGFAEGGYTGSGGKNEPAGVVHRGEYVFTAEEVAALGLGTLQGLSNMPGYAVGGHVGPTAFTPAWLNESQKDRETRENTKETKENTTEVKENTEISTEAIEKAEESIETMSGNIEASEVNTGSTNQNTGALEASTSAMGNFTEMARSAVEALGTIAGGIIGGGIGSVAGPIGTVAGAKVGKNYAAEVMDEVTDWMFGEDDWNELSPNQQNAIDTELEDFFSELDKLQFGEPSGSGGGAPGGANQGGYGTDSPGPGFASGGYVDRLMIPNGDDGWAGLSFGEGIVNPRGMENLARINDGTFGGGDNSQIISRLERIISLLSNEKATLLIDGNEFSGWIKRTTSNIIAHRENQRATGRTYA